jgi:hypothetical protein
VLPTERILNATAETPRTPRKTPRNIEFSFLGVCLIFLGVSAVAFGSDAET